MRGVMERIEKGTLRRVYGEEVCAAHAVMSVLSARDVVLLSRASVAGAGAKVRLSTLTGDWKKGEARRALRRLVRLAIMEESVETGSDEILVRITPAFGAAADSLWLGETRRAPQATAEETYGRHVQQPLPPWVRERVPAVDDVAKAVYSRWQRALYAMVGGARVNTDGMAGPREDDGGDEDELTAAALFRHAGLVRDSDELHERVRGVDDDDEEEGDNARNGDAGASVF